MNIGLRAPVTRRTPLSCTALACVLLLSLASGTGGDGLAAPAPREPNDRFEAFVLGVAQDGGVPHLGCDRECCGEARRRGAPLYPACLGIHDVRTGRLLLIEATPAIDSQVALLHELTGQGGRGRLPVDAVLLTHAHVGHYLGLAQLGREVAATDGLPVFVSPRMGAYLRSNGPWSQLVDLGQIEIHEFEPDRGFEPWPGLQIVPLAVPHRDEFSDTMAFRITGPRETLLFVPDVDSWSRHGELLDRLLEGVTVAYVDATFFDGRELPDRNMEEIPHPPMVDTMERLRVWGRERPGRLRFIHLNHTNPALRDPGIRDDVERRGFHIAERGERIPL